MQKFGKFFAICLLGVLCISCGKKDDQEVVKQAEYICYDFTSISEENIEAFAIQENKKILVSTLEERIFTYDITGTKNGELELPSFYGNLCCDGEQLYAYDYNQSAIMDLSSDEPRLIENSILFHTIRNMVAVDGKLYVLGIPWNEQNSDTFFSFGAQQYEAFGEQLYCIDTESGQYHTIDLEHITAEYRSESGKLYFYGWQEEQYYLYEYDTNKGKVTRKLHQDDMHNFLSIVVENDYLFGMDSGGGLVAVPLSGGGMEVLAEGCYTFFGNDLQFSQGNLFLYDLVQKKICRMAFIQEDGSIQLFYEKSEEMPDDAQGAAGENNSAVTESPKRNETIIVSRWGADLEFNTNAIKRLSGLKTRFREQPVDMEVLVTELMAGNEEVDIYILSTACAVSLNCRDYGIYTPLNDSEILSRYLEGCFDQVQAAATAENGDIWMFPLYSYLYLTWYVPENMEKFGLTEENLDTLEHYLNTLEQMQGKLGNYQYYNACNVFESYCDIQYDFVYNDAGHGQVNFRTEAYRSFAEKLWSGWERYQGIAEHPLFYKREQDYPDGNHMTLGKTLDFERSHVVFKTDYLGNHLVETLSRNEALDGWRVMPAPKFADVSEQSASYMYYAVVNPYGKQKEAAIAWLETIAAKRTETLQNPVFYEEDISAYEGEYDTSLPAFQDLYEIAKDTGIWFAYSLDNSDDYILEYQQGKITLDQAIERRQKRAEAGLYE